MEMKNILVVGAHYDDAELGAGGTMAKLSSQGCKVYKLTLTDNVTNFSHMNIHVDFDSSAMQSKKACEVLGAEEVYLKKPVECSTLEYKKEVMQEIEAIIFEKEIDTVIIHHNDDMNQDHIAAFKNCITAARHCKNILTYQSNGYILNEAFIPNYFVDISDFVELKRKSLEQYGEEHNRFDRLFEMNIERCHVWGYSNKCEYAEGFRVIKMLG